MRVAQVAVRVVRTVRVVGNNAVRHVDRGFVAVRHVRVLQRVVEVCVGGWVGVVVLGCLGVGYGGLALGAHVRRAAKVNGLFGLRDLGRVPQVHKQFGVRQHHVVERYPRRQQRAQRRVVRVHGVQLFERTRGNVSAHGFVQRVVERERRVLGRGCRSSGGSRRVRCGLQPRNRVLREVHQRRLHNRVRGASKREDNVLAKVVHEVAVAQGCFGACRKLVLDLGTGRVVQGHWVWRQQPQLVAKVGVDPVVVLLCGARVPAPPTQVVDVLDGQTERLFVFLTRVGITCFVNAHALHVRVVLVPKDRLDGRQRVVARRGHHR